MSQADVEFVEALWSAAGAMDKQALLAALPELIAQTCTPDIEWVEAPQRADSGVHHGHQGVQRSWERWLEQWDEYGYEAERLIDCDDGVLVIAHEHGTGASSGAQVEARIYALFTMRDGKIARYREFYDERAAFNAAGLEQ